ncbi:hypothetical protein BJ170DRAFT_235596 [Xylariales sp. AK1849]|nr:hypothetical protein BJ170DRAFT_235596 [Xylariales sp. AK1849]
MRQLHVREPLVLSRTRNGMYAAFYNKVKSPKQYNSESAGDVLTSYPDTHHDMDTILLEPFHAIGSEDTSLNCPMVLRGVRGRRDLFDYQPCIFSCLRSEALWTTRVGFATTTAMVLSRTRDRRCMPPFQPLAILLTVQLEGQVEALGCRPFPQSPRAMIEIHEVVPVCGLRRSAAITRVLVGSRVHVSGFIDGTGSAGIGQHSRSAYLFEYVYPLAESPRRACDTCRKGSI